MTGPLPFLAPLLDKMVAHDVRRQFTAQEALAFFEEHAAAVPQDTLAARATRGQHRGPSYEDYDRWEALPPALVRAWSHLRERPVSEWTAFLRRVCKTCPRAERCIRVARRVLALFRVFW
jgi:hypothetical protein